MKTQYVLESVLELLEIVEEHDKKNLPKLTGKLNVDKEGDEHFIVLYNDPVYQFRMPLKSFTLALCEANSIPLYSTDFLPE